ncbi:MAG: hypothetical protein IKF55_03240 [Oscillospiraceae bacterium]|nr:hypothetical protein [Oscillospiraceae bacterium]
MATEEKLTRKERRQRWKAAQKAKKEEKKEYYRYAPWGKRVWNLYVKKPLGILLVIVILATLVVSNYQTIINDVAVPMLRKSMLDAMSKPLTAEQEEELLRRAPIDEEGAAKIASHAVPVREDETWTVCVYIVGADLEDFDENDFSELVLYETKAAREKADAAKSEKKAEHFTRFQNELKANGLGLPAYFYEPVTPVASSTVVKEDVKVSDEEGYGSHALAGLTSGAWPDSVNIVVQTGGATHWGNRMVNPNRTQRFLYSGGEFREIADLPLQQASDPKTLAGFLRFCRDEYPADHNMLIFFDHGGGPFGYGRDSIFGEMMSLKQLREALSSVYQPDRDNPPFDILGFDACLMSNLDVVHALDGFADFYCLSEEYEPAPGWDHSAWLHALAENPEMSPAEIARTIADVYIHQHVAIGMNVPLGASSVTFSVVDAHRAQALYEAYEALAQAQLKDAATDISVLSDIGRSANRCTRYAGEKADVYNLIDLGNYADLQSENYPEECARIRELLGEAVLYHRESGCMRDSSGMSIYFPAEINSLDGLERFQNYIYDICESDSVRALYYYKQAGCLSEELQEYLATLTDKKPKSLDVTPFQNFGKPDASFDSEGFLLPVSEELQNMIVDYDLEIARMDQESNRLINYGKDAVLRLDGEGHLVSEFDGRWVCLNDVPLYTEVVSASASSVEYRAKVRYGIKEASLMIARDRDTDELSITGLYIQSGMQSEPLLGHSVNELKSGDRISPIYMVTDLKTGTSKTETGKSILFSGRTDLEYRPLPEGDYVASAVITDQRGDSYYSQVFGARMANGRMGDWHVEANFFGRAY